ncbi:molybdate ABC transporter substrate-binding protein [Hippea jasoniae]|uniref:molybdate ABC transporter substrate-binding protein n=1 Tax=Hippea jasoniae TaxID=944479 RepID=UPI00054F7709|nr:substrate-binding domain-containing protein [Hippea jasoniae]
MKRIILMGIVLSFLSGISYADTLYWFTGAGIKKPAEIIAKEFNRTHSDKVALISGGSGQVLNEMLQAKRGDVYTFMDRFFLKKAIRKGIVVKDRRFLTMEPVFALSESGKKKIKTFKDLQKNGIKIAGGNPKSMCLGQAFEEILNKLPQAERRSIEKNITIKCLNVMQIIGYLKSNVVDAGIILDKALLRGTGLGYIKIPEAYRVYRYGYIALIKYSKNKKAAKELYNFILAHLSVYKKFGFNAY